MEKAKSFLVFPWNFFFMGHKVILIFIFKNIALELTEIKEEERISIFDDNKRTRQ